MLSVTKLSYLTSVPEKQSWQGSCWQLLKSQHWFQWTSEVPVQKVKAWQSGSAEQRSRHSSSLWTPATWDRRLEGAQVKSPVQ